MVNSNKFLKLMIVDDEPFMREGLKVYLDWRSYSIGEITMTQDGCSALEIARKERPDIVITDIRMPEMSGLELISHIKKFLPDCICIIISGYNDFEYAKKGLELGAFYYIVKPIELAELKMVISNAVAEAEKKKQEKAVLSRFQGHSSKTKQYLIQDFLSKLTLEQSKLTDEQFGMTEKELEMNFQFPYYTACVTRLSVKNTFSQESVENILSMVEKKLYEELSANQLTGANVYCLHARNRLVVALGFQDPERVARHMERVFNSISETVAHCFHLFMVTVLGTTVSNANKLFFACTEAERLCSYKVFFNNAGFYRVSTANSIHMTNPFLFTSTEKKDLIAMVKNNNTDSIFNMLNILRNYTNNPVHQDKYVLFSILLEIMISTARILDVKKIKLEQFLNIEIFTYDFLETFDNADQLFQWLFEFFTVLSNAYVNKENTELESHLTEQIKKYTQENISSNINLSKIADHFHYSCNYIGRLFKKSEGVKFSEYLNALRIDMACELLKTTDYSVEEIASETGYSDPQYFIKVFKAVRGVTPRKYRSCVTDYNTGRQVR